MRALVSDEWLRPTVRRCGCDVVVASEIDVIVSAMEDEAHPEILLLEWGLVAAQPDAIERLQPLVTTDDVHCIVILPRERVAEDGLAVSCIADDVLLAPVERLDLEMRLRAARRFMELKEQHRLTAEKLEQESTHDAVTGALNRRAFDLLLIRELARSARLWTPLSLVYLDIDHFGAIVETLGQVAADAVLVEVYARLSRQLRLYDGIARYGGDELAVALPGCTSEQAAAVAERLREAIAAEPIAFESERIPVTACIGVAGTDALGASTAATLLRAAQRTLRAAKEAGRDRVEVTDTPTPKGSTPAAGNPWLTSQ
jgi:diguanylate cyclase (GGDEF)-like protein